LLGKLVKFILVTRFSKPLLAFMALMLAYYLLIGHFVAMSSSPFTSEIQYYGTGFTAFLFALMTLGGGVVVMKSDRDYLFTLPLDKRELALSLYIAQFVASGIMVFLMFGFFSSIIVLAGGASYFLLPVDLIAFALSVTSLSVISNVLETKWRLLVGAFLVLWALSALVGFAFSPASIFTGNEIYGSAAMLALTFAVTVVALRELSNVELGTMRSLIRATSSETKNIRTFDGMSPVRAIFSLNFYTFEFSGRVNMGTTSTYQSGSVRMSRLMPAAFVLALVYGYVALTLSPAGPMGNLVVETFPLIVIFIAFLSSQGGMANERAWLALTSMEPSLYFRYVSMAKAFSLAAIVSPFAIVNVVLALLGVEGAFAPVIPLLITIPCSTVLFLYWSSMVYPIQIKEEAPMMPSQFNLRQMTTVIPFLIFIAVVEASSIFFLAAVAMAAVSLGLTLYLLYNRNVWDRLVEKLVENGFV
jgi:hypothetical protein